MKKSHIIFLAAFLVSATVLKLWQYHWPEAVVEVQGERLTVLVAKTPWHWQRGLGKRDALEPYDGMVFLFPFAERHVFVMRAMRFPIDIIWMDKGVVVDIAPEVPIEEGVEEKNLSRYVPRAPANMVLELPAGWAEAHGLEIGDRLQVIEE